MKTDMGIRFLIPENPRVNILRLIGEWKPFFLQGDGQTMKYQSRSYAEGIEKHKNIALLVLLNINAKIFIFQIRGAPLIWF